ncbi:MAG: hypothetical protein GY832_37080 [Chloroflexi bacterium]|nr:hypothetical protein [Chloroflexota bacterium]
MGTMFVQPNWQTIDQSMAQKRRRFLWVLLFGMSVILILVGVAQRMVHRLVFQAILVDGGTWGIAWGLTVWYALRYRSERNQVAILTGILVALVFTIASLVPKWNIAGAWLPETLKSSPLLYWSVWHFLIVGIVWWLKRGYPQEMRALGLTLGNWRRNLVAGLLGGGVLIGHFLFVTAFTGAGVLRLPPFPYFVWQFGYEIASSLSTEVFFRAVVYHYFESEYGWGYWGSAFASAVFNLSIFMVKVKWTGDIITVIAVMFYIILISMINAELYRRTRNLTACYISGLVFNLSVMMLQ